MVATATIIMAVRNHKIRRSTTIAVEQMIRGRAQEVIHDTIKEAAIMHQMIMGSQTTLGTMLIQVVRVVVET